MNTIKIKLRYEILAFNEGGGKLKCKVSFDSRAEIYYGEKINNGYDPAEWYSAQLKYGALLAIGEP
jgi:hypothetical protein